MINSERARHSEVVAMLVFIIIIIRLRIRISIIIKKITKQKNKNNNNIIRTTIIIGSAYLLMALLRRTHSQSNRRAYSAFANASRVSSAFLKKRKASTQTRNTN